jgi:signal peptidase
MNNAIKQGLVKIILTAFVCLGFGAPVFAANYTLTVDNTSLSQNQTVLFDIPDLDPGFSQDFTIDIDNQSDMDVVIGLTQISRDPSELNYLLDPAIFSVLSDNSVTLASGQYDSPDLQDHDLICLSKYTANQLKLRVAMPKDTSNFYQDSSFKVQLTFSATEIADCANFQPQPVVPDSPDVPNPPDVNAPNTGFAYIIEQFLIVGLPLGLILAIFVVITVCFCRKRHSRKTYKTSVKQKKTEISSLKGKLNTIFMIVALLILAAAIVKVVILKEGDQYLLGFKPFIIVSGSMEPTYKTGSLVVVHRDDFRSANVGDVIAFRAAAIGDSVAFHRVIDKTDNALITQGDQVQIPDAAPVTAENYIGHGVFHTNFFVDFITHIQQPLGWLSVVVTLLVFLAIFAVIICLRRRSRKRKI